MSTATKKCTNCGIEYPVDSFRSRGGKYSHLKKSKCNKCLYVLYKDYVLKNEDRIKKYRQKDKWTLKKRCDRYDIHISELFDMYNIQDGKCCICSKEIDIEDSAIDHNHITGEFRGILCKICNRGLGMFRDNPNILLSAYQYLINKGYYGKFEK